MSSGTRDRLAFLANRGRCRRYSSDAKTGGWRALAQDSSATGTRDSIGKLSVEPSGWESAAYAAFPNESPMFS
jgi:hypothetical protein